jgi:hypothetical protein
LVEKVPQPVVDFHTGSRRLIDAYRLCRDHPIVRAALASGSVTLPAELIAPPTTGDEAATPAPLDPLSPAPEETGGNGSPAAAEVWKRTP